jgi:hypothetical protein
MATILNVHCSADAAMKLVVTPLRRMHRKPSELEMKRENFIARFSTHARSQTTINLEIFRGGGGRLLGLLSGLRRPPDLGYHYRRFCAKKVVQNAG